MDLHLQTTYLFVNDNILKRKWTKPEKLPPINTNKLVKAEKPRW